MPAIDWAFLCDEASIDASGKLSIIGAFTDLTARAVPFSHPKMCVALGLSLGAEDDHEVNTQIVSPDGTALAGLGPTRAKGEAEMQKKITTVVIFQYHQTRFLETGEHRIDILLDGQSVHQISFDVSLYSSAEQ
jgi:hypothetical protein